MVAATPQLKKLVAGMAILMVLAGLLYTATYLFINHGGSAEAVRVLVETELTKALGRKVEVGGLVLPFINVVSARDVKVYESPDGGSVIASADEISFHVNVRDILQRRFSTTSITSVSLARPYIRLERREDGSWNLSSLLSRSGERRLEFAAPVTVSDGTVELVGLDLPTSKITGIDGSFKFDGAVLAVDARARIFENSPTIAVSGTLDTGSGVMDVHVNTDGVTASLLRSLGAATVPGMEVMKGEFSLDVRLKGKLPGPYDYSGRVGLAGVTAKFDSFATPVTDIRGTVEFAGPVVTVEGLTGRLDGHPIRASGKVVAAKRPEMNLVVSAQDMPLELAKGLSIMKNAGEFGGRSSFTLNIKGYPGAVAAQGKVDVRDGFWDFEPLGGKLTSVNGSVTFDAAEAKLDRVTAVFMSSPVEISGSITGYSNPAYDLTVKSSSLALADLFSHKAFPVHYEAKGSGNLTAEVKGTAGDLYIFGELRAREGEIRREKVRDLLVKFKYGSGALDLSEFSVAAWGGKVSGHGVIGPDGKRYGFALPLRFENLDVTKLPQDLSGLVPLDKGLISGDLVVKGSGGKVTEAVGTVSASHGSFSGIGFSDGTLDLRYKDGRFTFDNLQASLSEGAKVKAKGFVGQDGFVNLSVDASRVDVALFERYLGDVDVKGKAHFVGTIAGAGDKLTVKGKVDLVDGALWGQKVDGVVGDIEYLGDKVALTGVTVSRGRASVIVNGTIGLSREGRAPGLSLDVQASRVPVAEVLKLAGAGLTGSGEMDARVSVSGTPEALKAVGRVSSASVSVEGVKLSSANLDFDYDKGRLAIKSLVAHLGRSSLQASGTVAKSGALDVTVKGQDFSSSDLGKALSGLPEVVILGTFDGKFTGTIDAPVLTVSVNMKNAQVEGASLGAGQAELVANLGLGKVELRRFEAAGGTARYTASGWYSAGKRQPASKTLPSFEVEADVSKGKLSDVVRILSPDSSIKLEGLLDGHLSAKGTPSRPEAKIDAVVTQGSAGGVGFDRADLSAVLKDGTLKLTSLNVRQGKGSLTGGGDIDFDGNTSITLNASGFDAGVLASFLGSKHQVSGMLDLRLVVRGPTKSPTAAVNLSAVHGKLDKLYYDTLNAIVTYDDGVLKIESSQLKQGGHVASIKGTLPVPERTLASLGLSDASKVRGKEMKVTVDMRKASLVMAMMLTQDIEFAEGSVDISVDLTGTLDKPRINGWAQVSGGKLKFAQLPESLEGLNVRASVKDSRIVIEKASATLGSGSVEARGSVVMEGLAPKTYDLAGTLRAVKLSLPVYEGSVDGDLTLRGTGSAPVLGGKVKLYRADIPLTLNGGKFEPPNIDLGLDLTVEVGTDVRIKSKEIDVEIVARGLSVSGTVAKPLASGYVEAKRGVVYFQGTRFMVTQGVAEFARLRGIEPLLQARAETVKQGVKVTVQLSGTPQNLAISWSSTPPLTEDEIFRLLSFYPGAIDRLLKGDVKGLLEDEVVRFLDSELRLYLLDDMAKAFRDMLSLDEFTIDAGLGSDNVTLKLGKYVFDDLLVTYTRTLQQAPDQSLKLEYTIKPGMTLYGEWGDEGKKSFGFETKFSF